MLNAVARLAEIPGVGPDMARAVIAETGLGYDQVPHREPPGVLGRALPDHRQSGTRSRTGKNRKGDTWLRGSLGQAANAAARADTFLGERYHRIARRRGKAKAQVAVARSILVIIWNLLADPEARYTDPGYGYHQARTDANRKLRNHVRQIQALGFNVTITQAAA